MTSPTSRGLEFAAIARRTSEAAGALIRSMGSPKDVAHKGVVDVVTEVDLASERELRRLLGEATPDIAILAEEGGGATRGTRWIVDPLDGTVNFVHGYPAYAVSIALQLDGALVAGAVHDVPNERTYWAARGAGAWCDERRMQVSIVPRLGDALLVTGFAYDRRERAAFYARMVEAFLAKGQCLRRGGSAALDFCLLADGRVDGYWELGLAPWDVAAGVLIVEEAGGRVSDAAGRPVDVDRPEVVASNGRIHDEMRAVLEPLLE
jgi:myo-inositol-1(or 4)-monophosphatase